MTGFDITDTLAPKSDQLDAVDLLGGPRVFTIDSVERGNAEQPVNVHLKEFPRVWRPGKSMRRVLAYCWGTETSTWPGKRLTLFCDPDVMFGGEKVGGTRISHLSHIDGPKYVPLIVKKGKSGTYLVEPMPRVVELQCEWHTATAERKTEIQAEVAAIRERGDQ